MNRDLQHSYRLSIFDTPEAAAAALVTKIVERTQTSIHEKEKCVWALSGGRTILTLYDALKCYKEEFKKWGDRLIVTWVDERAVPHSDNSSNFGNAYAYFWKEFEDIQLIPVPYHPDLQHSVKEYDSVLSANGIDIGDIDIALLGMGNDGHTASLFPNNKALYEKNAKLIGVEDPSVELPRISMTYPIINSSQSIFLFFLGTEKARTFVEATAKGDINHFPVLGIDNSKMEIYSDQDLKI